MRILRRSLRDTLLRLPQVLLGLVTFGIGISMLLVAELGNAPWDVLHQGLAEVLGVSIGSVIIAIGVLLVLAFVPLREPVGLGTLLNAVLIGLTANVVLANFEVPDELWARVALMLAAPAVVGLGSGLYIGSGLGAGPRDGLMTGIARRGFVTWKVRTTIEAIVLVAGVLLGGRFGLGTLWFVVAVGPCVHWFLDRFGAQPTPAVAVVCAESGE